jgi:GWxTD domain-containing protein
MKKIFTLVFTMYLGLSMAQDQTERINFAHQYDTEEEIMLRHVTGTDNDGIYTVLIGIYGNNERIVETDYIFTFRSLKSYSDSLNVPEILPSSQHIAGQKEKALIQRFTFPGISHPLLLCEIRNIRTGLTYFADLKVSDRKFPALLNDPTGMPVLASFVTEGRYLISGDSEIDFDIYEYEFPPAKPPMSTSPPDVSKTMQVSSSFSMDTTYDHIFDEAGLYVGRNVDNEIRMVYRTEGAYFPEYVTIPELVEPLVYITTSAEREQLIRNMEDKKSFDRFWLDLTGSKERAKWIIKNYYRRVTEANEFFTSYKPGWKTDRGMMYVIFGVPDEVIRNGKEEIWFYNNGLGDEQLLFSFRVIESPYAERQYILNRRADLSEPWMTAVKYWRQGMPIKDM